MRNWMFVSAAAVVVGLGTVVYYIFPSRLISPELVVATQSSVVVDAEVIPKNILLTAEIGEFRQWFPVYCGADMYIEENPKPHKVDVCLNEIISRVQAQTKIKLTRADVLDPAVKAHWRNVMGVR